MLQWLHLIHIHTIPRFRLEATYEIREDIADVLQRVGAYYDDSDKVRFAGWARMGLPMRSFKVTEVRERERGGAVWEGCLGQPAC